MDVAQVLKIALSAVGAVTGSAAFAWRIRDEFSSYLRISLSVDQRADNWITIQTTADNRSFQAKNLSYSMLLIGPTDRGLGETIQTLMKAASHKLPIKNTNDLEYFVVEETVAVEDTAIIPLSFYYR